MYNKNIKNFIAVSVIIFFIGCVSLNDKKNRKVYYKEAIGVGKLWKVYLEKEVTKKQAKQLDKYIIAIYNSKNQLIHIIAKENGKDIFQAYYFYDQGFYDGKSPYKRTHIDIKGKKYSHIHGVYKGTKR
jgi:hypothetical protein